MTILDSLMFDDDIDVDGLDYEADLPTRVIDALISNLAPGDGAEWLGCAVTYRDVEVVRFGGYLGHKTWIEVRRGEDRAVIALYPGTYDEDDQIKLAKRYPRNWPDELYRITPLRRAFRATSESFAALVRLLGSASLKEAA